MISNKGFGSRQYIGDTNCFKLGSQSRNKSRHNTLNTFGVRRPWIDCVFHRVIGN